ncbi:hypothetical protein MAR_002333 [Mya arenaria]|uniref:Uncharacterized protein n=1 Tax=Mya arenaria TaxID=6604 RepID=A0ABY7FE82_MYAAR|nr:hypothetical protein MAR_002333 [Mya arenaria]
MTPTRAVDLECINGTFEDLCGFCLPDIRTLNGTQFQQLMINECGKRALVGGLGEQTLDFLINEAMPEANRSSSGRIKPGRYGILGYSLGGLMSCHAAWTRPAVFSFAACMSPSFWWPLNNETNDLCDFDFNNTTLTNPAYAVNRPPQRIFIDSGGLENVKPYNLTQAAIDAAHSISSHENYKLDENVWIEISPSGRHTILQSLRRMQNALKLLVGNARQQKHEEMPALHEHRSAPSAPCKNSTRTQANRGTGEDRREHWQHTRADGSPGPHHGLDGDGIRFLRKFAQPADTRCQTCQWLRRGGQSPQRRAEDHGAVLAVPDADGRP